MEIGTLTLMCVNLVCVSGAGALVLLALMHIQSRERRRPRLYDEPPLAQGKGLARTLRRYEESA